MNAEELSELMFLDRRAVIRLVEVIRELVPIVEDLIKRVEELERQIVRQRNI